jgi:hypothetical protein
VASWFIHTPQRAWNRGVRVLELHRVMEKEKERDMEEKRERESK